MARDPSPRDPSSDEMRRVLPSRIAHEIRTPLGVLMGAITQLEGQAPENAKTLELARRAVAQLTRLSDRLSLLSRAAVGFTDGLEMQAVAMGSAVQQAASIVLESRRRRGVTMTVTGTDIDARVSADPRLLVVAIAELIDNAVRHASSRVEVVVSRRDDLAIVTIDDDGPGLDDERRELLFQPTLGHGRPGGLGIGTWLCAEIVECFSGRVSAPATANVTRFELALATVRA